MITNTKAIQLLATFTDLELKRFARFLRSPYHNNNQQILTLFDYLKKYHPTYTAPKVNRERIYQQVFGEESFKVAKWRNLLSDFNALAESFLVHNHLQQQKEQKEQILITVLSERLYPRFKKKSEQLIAQLEEKKTYKTAEEYLQLYQLHYQLWHHLETEKFTTDASTFFKSQQYLMHFITMSCMTTKVEQTVREHFLNTQSTFPSLDIVYELLHDNKQIKFPPLYEIYEQVVKLYDSGEWKYYVEIKDFFIRHLTSLSKQIACDILVILNNYLTNAIRQGETHLLKEHFYLYQLGVRHHLFIQHGTMRDIEFFNVAITGLKLGAYEWVEEFMQTHTKYLNPQKVTYIIPLLKGYQAMFSGHFEQAILVLRYVQPEKDFKFLYVTKTLLIRAFYECWTKGGANYLLSLQDHIAAFEQLVRRNEKNTDTKKKAYLHFISFLRQLIKIHLNQPITAQNIQQLHTMLSEKRPIALASWLADKVAALPPTEQEAAIE